jgi:coenzyme PQQ precursor peptide PqqA
LDDRPGAKRSATLGSGGSALLHKHIHTGLKDVVDDLVGVGVAGAVGAVFTAPDNGPPRAGFCIPRPLEPSFAIVGMQMPACAILGAVLSFRWDDNLSSRQKGEISMAWKTPKIVEVPVGMEINMYACAARK